MAVALTNMLFASLLLFATAQAGPIVVPPAPAVPRFDASVIPSGLPFPSGCANPNWGPDNPKDCLMPKINGVIYDGPQNPTWDPTGAWSRWEVKTTRSLTPVVGIMIAHVPGTEAYLFLGRSSTISFSRDGDVVSGVYDLASNTFTNITEDSNPFCGGVAPTQEGRVMVAGGTTAEQPGGAPDGRRKLRLYDYQPSQRLFLPDTVAMRYDRWYPTVTLLADSNIFIIGGTRTATEHSTPNAWFEKWLSRNDTNYPIPRYSIEPTFLPQMGKQFYPAVFVLPTTDVFILQDQHSRIIRQDGRFRMQPGTNTPLEGPQYPSKWKTQFPHIGMAVMTALTWEDNYGSVEVIMFGGAPFPETNDTRQWCPSTNNTAKTTPANRFSYRLKISWTRTGTDWAYSFGSWIEEDMGIPRVGGDATLLPNGDIVISGGAQTGCSCGIRTGTNRGNYPALWPLLYQTDRPQDQRYSVLRASSVARMYHGTASLTTDGTIFVSGCDACEQRTIVTTAAWWIGSPDRRWEFRSEVFYPPYALDTRNKPEITAINRQTTNNPIPLVTFGTTFTIQWRAASGASVPSISRVALVAPSAVTHGFNSNQRVVFLKIVDSTSDTITVQMPPTTLTGALPPQIYKVFLLNGKTYSRAWWVRVVTRIPPPGGR